THLQAGTYSVTFRAVDDGNGTGTPLGDTAIVPITVLNVNRPPVIAPVANVTVARGDTATIDVSATDPEGNPLVLSATSEQPGFPLPSFVTFVDNGDGTGRFSVNPAANNRGDHAIKLFARDDGDGGTSPVQTTEYVFVIKVTSPNEPPVIAYIGDVVALVGATMRVAVDVADMDEDALNYVLSGLPAGAVITPSPVYGKAEITWTPSAGDIGTHTGTVTVTDSGAGVVTPESAARGFKIVVRTANGAPLLLPVGDRSVAEGATLAFTLSGTDPDSDKLTYSATGLPVGATLNAETGAFSWTPALNKAGEYTVVFRTSDGQASSEETVKITVTNTNQLPRFVPVVTQQAREGLELRFTVVAPDADADPVVLSASGLPAGALFVPTRGEFVWTPGFDQQGLYTVRFAAQDPSGTPVFQDVQIRVANVNRAPVLANSDHSFLIGAEKSFTIAASDPDIGTDLTFSAINLPEGATVNADSGVLTWTPGPGQTGEYIVTLQVSDGQAVERQSIVLRASLAPIAPIVRIEQTPSFPALPGQRVLLHPVADSFSDIVSLRLFANGVEVPLDATGRATITAGAPGKVTLLAIAIDADGVEGRVTTQLKIRDGADKAAPLVAFAAGLPGLIQDSALELRGLVQDGNLDVWSLEIAPGFSGAFTRLAGGETNVDGVLTSLDPRRFADGFYTLRLQATDMSGRTSRVEQLVELRSLAKLGQYERTETDVTVDFGGISFALRRAYDSLDNSAGIFGTGWTLLGREVAIETNVAPTGREHLGIHTPFVDGTRLYLTLPTGERAGFSFVPMLETIGTAKFYRPAWVADGTHGWTLQSSSTLLTKAGAKYFDAASGQPYNPANPVFAGSDYTLTAPDGTVHLIEAQRGITEIRNTAGKRLFLSDSGVTAEDGASLRFVRDTAGRLSRVSAPDGTSLIYLYDDAGNLVTVRNLTTGAGNRYGYAGGELAIATAIGGTGETVSYLGDGSVRVTPVDGDLGTSGVFNGVPRSGDLGAGTEPDIFTFSVRQSEIDATAGKRLIVRVALDGAGVADPAVTGVTPLSIERVGGRVVGLFGITAEGLYQLRITGIGAYSATLAIAGDVDLDGDVDGADADLVAAVAPGSDVTGDGTTDALDRQVLFANYGFLVNKGPQIALSLPSVLTHTDLPVFVNLAAIATDPNGDAVYYRVVGAENGTAALTPDGRSIMFTPTTGFSGLGRFEVVADDGYASSSAARIDVNVSSAKLTSLEFSKRRILMEKDQAVAIQVIGDFADQADVVLPLWYVAGTT
ncbi:MAG: tandem-95 repeat protein, partial [Alphaproteobacteria bacterium]|nr:tandem-95 repeat protein [Alphaproteobacteria bacterium]